MKRWRKFAHHTTTSGQVKTQTIKYNQQITWKKRCVVCCYIQIVNYIIKPINELNQDKGSDRFELNRKK